MNGDFTYKNWSLNVLFQGATNYSVFNSDQFVMPFGDNMTPYAFGKNVGQKIIRTLMQNYLGQDFQKDIQIHINLHFGYNKMLITFV